MALVIFVKHRDYEMDTIRTGWQIEWYIFTIQPCYNAMWQCFGHWIHYETDSQCLCFHNRTMHYIMRVKLYPWPWKVNPISSFVLIIEAPKRSWYSGNAAVPSAYARLVCLYFSIRLAQFSWIHWQMYYQINAF